MFASQFLRIQPLDAKPVAVPSFYTTDVRSPVIVALCSSICWSLGGAAAGYVGVVSPSQSTVPEVWEKWEALKPGTELCEWWWAGDGAARLGRGRGRGAPKVGVAFIP